MRVIVVLVALFGHYRVVRSIQSGSVCNTSACQVLAKELTDSMNKAVDPCNNFYEYICGNWNRTHQKPPHMSRFGTLTVMDTKTKADARAILDELQPSPLEPLVSYVKQLYDVCMDTDRLEKREANTQFIAQLRQLGAFPMLQAAEWQGGAFYTLAESMRRYASIMYDIPYVSFYPDADPGNSSRIILQIGQPRLPLPREFYLNPKQFERFFNALRTYMSEMANTVASDAGVTLNEERLKESVDAAIRVQTKLARIMLSEEELRDPRKRYNIFILKGLAGANGQIEWFELLRRVVPPVMHSYWQDQTLVNVETPAYIRSLAEILADRSLHTALMDIAMLSYASKLSSTLDARYKRISDDFLRTSFGIEPEPRWRTCLSRVDTLGKVFSTLYLRKYFDVASKRDVNDMIDEIEASFNNLLQQVDWMDEATRARALVKAAAIRRKIGFPEWILDERQLNEYYEGLKLEPNETFYTVAGRIRDWTLAKEAKKLLKPNDRRFFSEVYKVNAFYNPSENSIVFPAGILQAPVFHPDYPRAVNYAAIGSVIGHEITHGFDDSGSQYDKFGNVQDWWEAATKERFAARGKCMVEQYNQYKISAIPNGNVTVNGQLTLGENIADNGGVRAAYEAYIKSLRKQSDLRLPGMEGVSNEQLFFMSFGHVWCNTVNEEAAQQMAHLDPHSPDDVRVIGTISNMEQFADAFKCPSNSKMNPVRKCRVW